MDQSAHKTIWSNRTVWIVAFDGMQSLDLAGPLDVFRSATRLLAAGGDKASGYEVSIIGLESSEVTTEAGLVIQAEPRPEPDGAPHTLLIPGGDGSRVVGDEALGWVRSVGQSSERVATVCTGAFIAADAGLTEGRKVATHWSATASLQDKYPTLVVDPDSVFVRDDKFWSSAGVTAGIDLALALVEEDFGPVLAQEVARWLVVFVRRPGGQSQFAPPVWNPPASAEPIRRAQDLIHSDPGTDLSNSVLSNFVGLSKRHFSRLFATETGETPASYVEKVRISAARNLLSSSDQGLETIARACGFGTGETMRRAFHRNLGLSPDSYRTFHSIN